MPPKSRRQQGTSGDVFDDDRAGDEKGLLKFDLLGEPVSIKDSTLAVGTGLAVGALMLRRFQAAAPNQVLVRSGFGVGMTRTLFRPFAPFASSRLIMTPKLKATKPSSPQPLGGDVLSTDDDSSSTSSTSLVGVSREADRDVAVGRWFVRFPFQYVWPISLEPRDYMVQLHAMSKEKMTFRLPAHFIIGVKSDDPEYVKRNAKHLHARQSEDQKRMIESIILGQARVLAANLGIEDIFKGRDAFRESMIASVAEPLSALGLHVINANFSDLGDDEGSNYFKELSKSIQAQATNRAKAEVARQDKEGTVGEKERQTESRISVSQMEREATFAENENKAQIASSQAQLDKKTAETWFIGRSAHILSETDAALLKAQKEAEMYRATIQTKTEQERALHLSQTTVRAEVEAKTAEGLANAEIKVAEGKAASLRLVAEAQLFQTEQESKGKVILAKAAAEGILLEMEAKAKGLERLYHVQAQGFTNISKAFTQDEVGQRLLQYIAMDKDVIQTVAKYQAEATKDMKPNLTVWSPTGQHAHDTVRSLVPSLDTILKQAGIFSNLFASSNSKTSSSSSHSHAIPSSKPDVKE